MIILQNDHLIINMLMQKEFSFLIIFHREREKEDGLIFCILLRTNHAKYQQEDGDSQKTNFHRC